MSRNTIPVTAPPDGSWWVAREIQVTSPTIISSKPVTTNPGRRLRCTCVLDVRVLGVLDVRVLGVLDVRVLGVLDVRVLGVLDVRVLDVLVARVLDGVGRVTRGGWAGQP